MVFDNRVYRLGERTFVERSPLMRVDSAPRGDHSLLYQGTIAPTGKTDESGRERTEQVEMISKSFVTREGHRVPN
jgi:hypothetical protein